MYLSADIVSVICDFSYACCRHPQEIQIRQLLNFNLHKTITNRSACPPSISQPLSGAEGSEGLVILKTPE